MINSIIEAISIALNAEFTEKEFEIYMEEMKQGINEPCFFIACLEPTSDVFLGKRYYTTNNFVIQYFPESTDNTQRECNSIAERMKWCLEYITTQGDEKPIRGDGMHYEIVDGVLNFFVSYDLFIRLIEENEAMEGMDSDIAVNGGE